MTQTPSSPPPPETAAPLPPQAPPGKDDCSMAMLAHLLAIFTGFIGPLIIWLVKKDTSRFVDQQGKEALNWAITVAIIALVIIALIPVLGFADELHELQRTSGPRVIIALTIILGWIIECIGCLGMLACNIVFNIQGCVATSKGLPYRYPLCIRFIK